MPGIMFWVVVSIEEPKVDAVEGKTATLVTRKFHFVDPSMNTVAK